MTSQLLRAADRLAMPWRNGRGVTREVAAFPPGAGLTEFEWRVSIAEITTDTPFSRFEGVDRMLVPLAGAMTLEVEGQQLALDPASSPLRLAGEATVRAVVGAGPVLMLNLMARRGRSEAQLARKGEDQSARGPVLLIAAAPATVIVADAEMTLRPCDALELAAGPPAVVVAGVLWAASFAQLPAA